MNGFVRQLAALAALWALCELLLPKRQQMVRLAVSLMVMAALVLSLGQLLGHVRQTDWPAFAGPQPAVTGYERIALTSLANQLEHACVQLARKAGYEAHAAVYLRQDGGVEKIRLFLQPGETPPLMEESALTAAMAKWLSLPAERLEWQALQGEEMP